MFVPEEIRREGATVFTSMGGRAPSTVVDEDVVTVVVVVVASADVVVELVLEAAVSVDGGCGVPSSAGAVLAAVTVLVGAVESCARVATHPSASVAARPLTRRSFVFIKFLFFSQTFCHQSFHDITLCSGWDGWFVTGSGT